MCQNKQQEKKMKKNYYNLKSKEKTNKTLKRKAKTHCLETF